MTSGIIFFGIKVPAETKVYIGEAGYQNGFYTDGAVHIAVPKPWVIPGFEIIPSEPLK